MPHAFSSELQKILETLGVIETWAHRLRSDLAPVTKTDLHQLGDKIMSVISDFAAKQNAFNDRMDAAVAGIQGDVQALNDLITKLQNSPGTITPEDQASLDALQARAQTVTDKLEALDALTPPTPPTV